MCVLLTLMHTSSPSTSQPTPTTCLAQLQGDPLLTLPDLGSPVAQPNNKEKRILGMCRVQPRNDDAAGAAARHSRAAEPHHHTGSASSTDCSFQALGTTGLTQHRLPQPRFNDAVAWTAMARSKGQARLRLGEGHPSH